MFFTLISISPENAWVEIVVDINFPKVLDGLEEWVRIYDVIPIDGTDIRPGVSPNPFGLTFCFFAEDILHASNLLPGADIITRSDSSNSRYCPLHKQLFPTTGRLHIEQVNKLVCFRSGCGAGGGLTIPNSARESLPLSMRGEEAPESTTRNFPL